MGTEKDRENLMAHWRQSAFESPLCKAIVVGDMPGLAAILAGGASPNQEDRILARRPVELAVEFKSIEALEALLAAGAEPFACKKGNNHGFTLSALATAWDWPEGLDALKAHGAPMWSEDFVGFGSPLRSAVSYNHFRCAKKLVEWGAAAEPWGSRWDKGGPAPMARCAMAGLLKMARMLHGANPNLLDAPSEGGLRPVHFAACNGRMEFISWLARNGADLGALDDEGLSAADHAKKANKPKTVHALQALAALAQAKEIATAAREGVATPAASKPRL